MIEKDLSHIRFLKERSLKGDSLSHEDYTFILSMDDQIKIIQNQIDTILQNEKEKNMFC